jgi:hypothetical protein
LISTNEWGAVGSKASAFKAGEAPGSKRKFENPHRKSSQKKHEYNSFEEWFDSCQCDRCGKKGHPTYAHDNIKAHRKRQIPRCPRKSGSKLKFKSKKDKSQFEKAVHKAMLEYMDDCSSSEEEGALQANIAGEESSDDEDGSEGQRFSEGDKSDSDEGVSALLACALKNLVKD